MITTIHDWLNSFGTNNNTGVEEEKRTGLEILVKSNLDKITNLPKEYMGIVTEPHINGIKGLLNLTQNDDVGGTGDIGIVYDDTIKYFSVTQWNNNIGKCMCNVSGRKWYKLQKSRELNEMNNEAFQQAKNYRMEKFGITPNLDWKRVTDCPGARSMCEYLAKKGSSSWNSMNSQDKMKHLHRFIDINSRLIPKTSGIIYWDKKNNSIKKIFKWELTINLEDYLETFSDGNYIYHGKPNDFILCTQTKYNNGIIEGMSSKKSPENWKLRKSVNYLSSWNVVAKDLTKIFNMTEVSLSK